ncbi:unnamed protein product [Peronospora belbahrii]|uniref:Uncharacterized protein n=1 Tax=Peronospora belbahrii TaxID=622444 RepID=A0AAU9KRL8_9STRA|nr:unnamed protein product [Peronospora belbahrii]
METPTTPTTRRPMMTARASSFSSARMLEAQMAFQNVVKHELQLLLVDGMKREEAVKLLLRRIVASTEPPEATAVRGVMRQFQMNYDDAMRALIVKQELGRLKRQGLDSFAAIEELTRKMKSREDETEQVVEQEKRREERGEDNEQGKGVAKQGEEDEGLMMEEVDQHKDIASEEKKEEDKENWAQEEKNKKQYTEKVEEMVQSIEEVEDTKNLVQEENNDKKSVSIPAAEMASPTSEKDGNETSMSLCQRIGQVSISSGNTPEKESEGHDNGLEEVENTDEEANESAGEKNKASRKSPLRVRNSFNSNLADLTPQSRKRRATSGIKYETSSNNCSNSVERNAKPLFPNLKKQKLCAAVGDGYLEIVTLKSKSTSTNLAKSTSAAGTSGSSPGGEKGGGIEARRPQHKELTQAATCKSDRDGR